jgi:hypothetical protein
LKRFASEGEKKMEIRLFLIVMISLVCSMMFGGSFTETARRDCKASLAQSTRTLDEIEKICK